MIPFLITLICSQLLFAMMFRNSIRGNSTVYDQGATWWRPGKCVQIENTWVWSTQNRIGIVWHGISSEDIDARSSNIENDGEEKHRSETQTAKLWRQKMRELKQGQWLRIAGVNVVLKEDKENAINGKRMDSVREETSVVSGTMNISVQSRLNHRHKEVEVRRGKRASSGWSPSGKFARQPCKVYLKGICTKSPCDSWHSPECQFCKSESGCKFGDKCSFGHRKVIPAK